MAEAMTKSSYSSADTEADWKRRGEPYCEHPAFTKDRGPFGPDWHDFHCIECGAIRVEYQGEPPPPRGVK